MAKKPKKIDSQSGKGNSVNNAIPVSDNTSKSDKPVSDTTSKSDKPVNDTTSKSDKPVNDTTSKSDKPVNDNKSKSDKPVNDTTSKSDKSVNDNKSVFDLAVEAIRNGKATDEQIKIAFKGGYEGGPATQAEYDRLGLTNKPVESTNSNESTDDEPTNDESTNVEPVEPVEPVKQTYAQPDLTNSAIAKLVDTAAGQTRDLNDKTYEDTKADRDAKLKELYRNYGKQNTNEYTYSTRIPDSLRNQEFGAYDYKAEKKLKEIAAKQTQINDINKAINENKLADIYEITPLEVEQEKNRISSEILDLQKQLKSTNDKKESKKLTNQIANLDKLIEDDDAVKQGLYLKLAERDIANLKDERSVLRSEFKEAWNDTDERNARNKAGYFIANSLGTTLSNMGKAFQGKDANVESDYSKIRGKNIQSAIDRRNKRFDTLLDEQIQVNHLNTEEAKDFKDIMTQIKQIYPNATNVEVQLMAQTYGEIKSFTNLSQQDRANLMLLRTAAQGGVPGLLAATIEVVGLDTLNNIGEDILKRVGVWDGVKSYFDNVNKGETEQPLREAKE